ncbi:MAG: CehA/McbA family metallohydrolase [Candidatus Thermoplasmatota archaeon]|nr:CehA/McbA family metallohydrolase [Candidatus Thermoplasmatota archaeon]
MTQSSVYAALIIVLILSGCIGSERSGVDKQPDVNPPSSDNGNTNNGGSTGQKAIVITDEQKSAIFRGMNVYFGNIHSHTLYSDADEGMPEETLAWARDTVKYDFYAITDHSELFTIPFTNYENFPDMQPVLVNKWDDIGAKVDEFNKNGSFVAIRGFEWTSEEYGHINIFGTDTYTTSYPSMPVIGTTDWSTDLNTLYTWIDEHNAFAQYNHPCDAEGSGAQNLGNFTYDQRVGDNFFAMETGNADLGNNDEYYYNYYHILLDNGWKMAPTNNLDNHHFNYTSHRTAVICKNLTRNDIMEGIKAKRVYSTDDPNMEILFSNGANWMGSTMNYTASVAVFTTVVLDDENITKLELIGNGGKVVAEKTFAAGQDSRIVSWMPIVNVTENGYFFLKVTEKDENNDEAQRYNTELNVAEKKDTGGVQVAVTAPIWIVKVPTSQ